MYAAPDPNTVLSTSGKGAGAQTAADFGEYFGEVTRSIAMAAPGGPVSIIVAAVVTTITQLVKAITEGVIRRKEAVAWAYRLGITDAHQFPTFVVDVQRMSFAQRMALGDKLILQLKRPGLSEKARTTLQAKIDTVAVLMTLETMRARGELPPAAPQAVLVQEYETSPIPAWIAWTVGGTLAAAAVFLAV